MRAFRPLRGVQAVPAPSKRPAASAACALCRAGVSRRAFSASPGARNASRLPEETEPEPPSRPERTPEHQSNASDDSAPPESPLSDLPAYARAAGTTLSSPTSPWQAMIEGRIAEARRKGAFDNLQGRGKRIEDQGGVVGVDNTEFILNRMMKAQDILPSFLELARRHTELLSAFRDRLRKEWDTAPVLRDRRHRWWSAADVVQERRKEVERINAVAREHNLALPEKITFQRMRRGEINLEEELERVYDEMQPRV
ncbi:hypothetical protein DFJ74DRAFT_669161 [Hyaloraphidium curvatum]|nr:hypothetical protein DFJ74DRAFT_669161 [Hyaloraphidium curvatum]